MKNKLNEGEENLLRKVEKASKIVLKEDEELFKELNKKDKQEVNK